MTIRHSYTIPMALCTKRGKELKADSWDSMVRISRIIMGHSIGIGRPISRLV